LTLYAANDVRELVYPQFYGKWGLSDAEIVEMVKIGAKPQSDLGIRLLEKIKSTALKHSNALAPCEFLAYKGKIIGKKVKIYVYETEAGTKLLGPAALNCIYVYEGNVVGVPEKAMKHVSVPREAREKGLSVGFNYLDAIISLAVARIEKAVKLEERNVNIRVTMVKHPRDVNVRIGDPARRYITGKKKKIKIEGPVFVGVRAEIVK
ncbi:MAG: O-phosphoserine--tRNA ligase, partial [Candidatus Hermodarchaeota archaeon]